MTMQAPNRKLSDLKANPKNPRVISDAKLKMLRQAMDKFGDLGGVVWNAKSGRLVGGHQRMKVLPEGSRILIREYHRDPTPAGTKATGSITIGDESFAYREVWWDDATEKAANLAANKGAGEWDMPQVAEWVGELAADSFDLDLTMFDAEEVAQMLQPQAPTAAGLLEDDHEAAPPAIPTTKLGDVYQLGRHRLVCGDCTDGDTLDALFRGKKADITFTSPPYNAGKALRTKTSKDASMSKHKYGNYTDDLADDDYVRLLVNATNQAMNRSRFAFINLQLLGANKRALLKYQALMQEFIKDIFIWHKGHCPPHIVPGSFNTKWEYIFAMASGPDAESRAFPCQWQGQHPNIVETKNNGSNAMAEDHRAGFPLALPGWFLEKLDFVGSVFDPFCGTGTTLICAEQMNKTGYGCELDPGYCDLIVARWEKLTGQKAQLMGNGPEKVQANA